MKIEKVITSIVNEIENTKKDKNIESKNANIKDKIEISKESEVLIKMKNILNEEEKINEEKINEIKRKIENNEYEIDVEGIVEKLIEDIF